MLTELKIQNYRSIKKLDLDSLKRINLFTGKNNTGKTTLLEAVYLLMSNRPQTVIHSILSARGEISDAESSPLEWARIFHKQNNKFYENPIRIQSVAKFIDLSFVPYLEITDESTQNIKRVPVLKELFPFEEHLIGVQITTEAGESILPTDRRKLFYTGMRIGNEIDPNYKFIRTSSDNFTNAILWDNISLIDEKETIVLTALRLIEPAIEKLAFKGDNRVRKAFVKLKTQAEPVPIGSLGDGVNRILTVILALVNCEDGVLLIDEFENGLHYSVQTQLWNVIFELSQLLNVQIFATTHSNDCIASFYNILCSSENNKLQGQYFNLLRVNDTITVNPLSVDVLELALEQNIETR